MMWELVVRRNNVYLGVFLAEMTKTEPFLGKPQE